MISIGVKVLTIQQGLLTALTREFYCSFKEPFSTNVPPCVHKPRGATVKRGTRYQININYRYLQLIAYYREVRSPEPRFAG